MSRIPTVEDIKRIVLQMIQPLTSGSFDAIEDPQVNLADVPGFGSGNKYTMSYQFGLVGWPIKKTTAYFLHLHGGSLAPIILSHLDKFRPVPSEMGEVILYSLNADGSFTPVRMTLGKTGTLTVDCDEALLLNAMTQMIVTCNDVVFAGNSIKLGSEHSSEPVILGNVFKTFYNSHVHYGNLGYPTSAPLVPMDDLQLSTKSFTEL